MVEINIEVYYGQCTKCARRLWTLSEAWIAYVETGCPQCGQTLLYREMSDDFKSATRARVATLGRVTGIVK